MRPGAVAFRTVVQTVDDGFGAGSGDAGGTPAHRYAGGTPAFGDILTRLRQNRCGVIVGHHGTGKSTLLRQLAGQLERDMPGGAWIQLTQSLGYRDTLGNIRDLMLLRPTVAPGGVLVIDGAEQIPAIFRRWMARQCRRSHQYLLATSHHDLAGFETLYRTGLTPILIHELVDELLSQRDRAFAPGLRERVRNHLQKINLDEIENLRDLWDELYEIAELEVEG